MAIRRKRVRKATDQIVLLARDFPKKIHLFPDWVSNGHFAVHKARIKNSETFQSRETIRADSTFRKLEINEHEDNDMVRDGVLGDTALTPWTLQPISVACEVNKSARLALPTTGELDHAWIAAQYVELLIGYEASSKPVELYRSNTLAFADSDDLDLIRWIVMPISADQYLDSLRAFMVAYRLRS